MDNLYEDISSDEELDLRVREVRDAVDIYSYEANVDDEENQTDENSMDTVVFTRDGDVHFPFTNDEPELDKENQQLNNTCDKDTELTFSAIDNYSVNFLLARHMPSADKFFVPLWATIYSTPKVLTEEQKQIQDKYQATYGTRYLPPNYPCAVIQQIIDNWGVAKRIINNLPVLTIDVNAAYTIDVRSGSAFPWLLGNRNNAITTKRYLRSAHPGLGYNLLRTLKDAMILVDSYSYELGVELIYAYYHLVGENGDRIQEAHDKDVHNMVNYEQYELKYGRSKKRRRCQRVND
jgi:hypothetical protein